MTPYVSLAGYILLFLIGGFVAVWAALLVGRLIRPDKPDPEKLEVYECGEPTIGSSWIQFDLRFYVVALLFVIFDVEVAFFFPWATVFGTTRHLADPSVDDATRAALTEKLSGAPVEAVRPAIAEAAGESLTAESAQTLLLIALADIAVFFGVILLGFAYVWKRGDIEWVRSTIAEEVPPEDLLEQVVGEPTPEPATPELSLVR